MLKDTTTDSDTQVRITFFSGDQTNCFPDSRVDPTWSQLMTMYRVGARAGAGASKGSRGYAIFACLRPGTEASCAAIQGRRRERNAEWTMSDDQRASVMEEGYRDESHMVAASCVVIDYDGDPGKAPDWSPDSWPCEIFAHSTHSHCPLRPGSWRVFMRLAKPIPMGIYHEVVYALKRILPAHTNLRAGVQPAFLPTCPEGSEVLFAHVHPDQPLDWEALLSATPPPLRPTSLPIAMELAANEMPAAYEICQVVAALAAVWPASGCGTCYETALAMGGVMGRSGWPADAIATFLSSLYQDAEWQDVPKCVHWSMTSVSNVREDGKVFGWPKLRECVVGPGADVALKLLSDIIHPPPTEIEPVTQPLMSDVTLTPITQPEKPSESQLTTGDNEDIARVICATELEGAIFDEGVLWRQCPDTFVWEEIDESAIHNMVGSFSGQEYAHKISEKGASTCKVVLVSHVKCVDVRKRISSMVDRKGYFAGASVGGVAFRNGFLDPSTKELTSLKDKRVRHVLGWDYSPHIIEQKPPMSWIAFVTSIWGDDANAIQCIHEIIGYLLSGRLDMQKMFVFLGPTRAGKGVVLHLLRALFGSACGSFKIAALDQPFAMAPFVRKKVMVDPDVRKVRGRNTNTGVIAERLLSTVAGDEQTISRKFMGDINAVLHSRIVMAANPPFGLLDEGGALSKRMVILPFPTSFLGREDSDMISKILRDLPGIVALALDALDELSARGRFAEPESAAEARTDAQHMETPALGFLDEMCTIAPGHETPKPQLYRAYVQWCEENGGRPAHMNVFGAVCKQQGIGTRQIRADGERVRVFTGVAIESSVNTALRVVKSK